MPPEGGRYRFKRAGRMPALQGKGNGKMLT